MYPLPLGWMWIPGCKCGVCLSFLSFCESDLWCKIIQSVRERKSLTNHFNSTKTEIEKLRNSLKQIGNQNFIFGWIDTFGIYISEKRYIPDPLKKILLKQILDCISVDYDWEEKVHRLNIHFKIPVFSGDQNIKYGSNIPEPSEPLRNQPDQLVPVETYSTVKRSSTTGGDICTSGYSLRMNVLLVSPNLWTSSYSSYQQQIFDVIRGLHEDDGWNFKQISDWLNEKGYLTPRGKVFRENHVWSIYTKKLRSIKRFSREYPHTITDMKVDVVDYVGKG